MALFGDDDKTEQPTGRRLDDARKKGQIARSTRAPRAATLAAVIIVFSWTGESMMTRLATTLGSVLAGLGTNPLRTVVEGELVRILVEGAGMLALVVGPIAVGTALAVVTVQISQGGWNASLEPLQLDLSRLNPAAGMKRLIGQGPVELLMLVIPAGIVTWVAWNQLSDFIGGSAVLSRMTPVEAARHGWQIAHGLFVRVAVTMVILAAADFGFQKYRHIKGLRMTKQEVKDDSKMQDGNPEIKGRVRMLQRQIAMRRMLADVGKATVVITNPTHFAVAIEYHRHSMGAPRVLAKGRDKLALRIKDLARERGVPVVENRTLAQALYWGAEVGEYIPAPLFEAVAEVLAYLIRLKQLTL